MLLRVGEQLQRLFNDLLMIYHRFVLSILKDSAERNVSTLNIKSVYFCLLFCHSLTHTYTLRNSQISAFLFSALSFFVCSLSVLLKEFSIHLIPLLVLLYWGWAPLVFHVKGFFFFLLNIKSSVSRLALSSPCSAPCIFRSRRQCCKAG